MKMTGWSRREFLGTTGKAAVAAAAGGWACCGSACGASAADACVGAVCGIYCGACPGLMQSLAAKTSAEVKCLGCLSTKKAPGHAPKCDVRKCAFEKQLQSCGLCKSYPCEKITARFNDKPKYGLQEKYLNMVRDKGLPAWLAAMKERWSCPKCRTPFGYGMKTCPKCNEKIYSDAEEFAEFRKNKPGKA